MVMDRVRAFLERAQSAAPGVSAWSVGQHIEHSSKAVIYITGALRESQPPAPPAKWSLIRWIVLTTGYIPRGRAKAPAAVTPDGQPSEADLLALLARMEEGVAATRQLDPGAWFAHFALGIFRRDQALRFIDVHTRHHLKIMRDIVAASKT